MRGSLGTPCLEIIYRGHCILVCYLLPCPFKTCRRVDDVLFPFSAPPPPNVRGRVWWHTTDNDSKEHITVRYNRRANRVHIYRDGTVNVSPQKPTARVVAAGTGESEEGYDSVPEFSDEEWDE